MVSRSIEPKAPAYRATVSGVIEAPTIPRAPEIESMSGASDWGTVVLPDHIDGGLKYRESVASRQAR